MPTNVTDQFFTFDPANPPPVGTSVTFTKYTLTDQNDDGDIDEFDNDAVTGLDVSASWPGDTVTINVPGEDDITYVGTTLYLSDGSVIFTPTDGQPLQAGDFVSSTYVTSQGPLMLSELGPPCFLPGTLISTPKGQRCIENLRAGDLVDTVDRGPVPLVFVRSRYVSWEHLKEHPRHAPVLIPEGAFGPRLPERPLRVSPQHRVLLRSRAVERMFGVPEVLAPAAQLIGQSGIARDTARDGVEYIHLLFDHHAIIHANGLRVESLFLGENVLHELTRQEFVALKAKHRFDLKNPMQPARVFASGKRLKHLLARHAKNEIPLLNGAPDGWERAQDLRRKSA